MMITDRARAAAAAPRLSKADQQQRGLGPQLGREPGLETHARRLGRGARASGGPTEPLRQPPHVRVHDDARAVQAERHRRHQVGNLGAHPRKPLQLARRVRHHAFES